MGIGDVNSLIDIIGWAHSIKISLLNLDSINELDITGTYPISYLALDPALLHIKPNLIPGLTMEDIKEIAPDSLLIKLRSADQVQYTRVRELKHDILWKAFNRFYETQDRFMRERKEFDAFQEADQLNWLNEYAIFSTLAAFNRHFNWEEWPEEHQNLQTSLEWIEKQLPSFYEKFKKQILFYKFIQWLVINRPSAQLK